jgi:8-oxo-dGTP pyrophosphatase MutT (NUDIX family)
MPPRRRAAVMLAILAGAPHGVIFVERAAHLKNHPGQIGLPGGAVDDSDGGDLRRTALREMHEEVGVVPERVHVVGELPMVSQRNNVFDVTPFVGVVDPGPLTIDAGETAAVFTIPLQIILSDALREGTISFAERVVESHVLDYDGRRVWGLTGKILRSFADAWYDAANPLRAAVEGGLHAKKRGSGV